MKCGTIKDQNDRHCLARGNHSLANPNQLRLRRLACVRPSLEESESESLMWNLSHSKALAVGLSFASTLSAGSIARTISIAMQEPRAGVQPAVLPNVPHLPIGMLPWGLGLLWAATQRTIRLVVAGTNKESGQISYNLRTDPRSEDPSNPANPAAGYNPSVPYRPGMQGGDITIAPTGPTPSP